MKTIYYILMYTWGIVLTLIGFAAAVGLMLLGVKPRRFGPCWHFQFGKNWGGLSLGLVIITDDSPSLHTLKHEFGHTLQNCVFGPFFLFVTIASATRYWIRRYQTTQGKALPPYDSIWFEGQATQWGTKYFDQFVRKDT